MDRSLARYDAFYNEIKKVFQRLEERFGCFVVLDLHTYNHRRSGPDGPPDDPQKNPEVNIGTGSMEREKWAPVVEDLMAGLRVFDHRYMVRSSG